MPDVPRPSSAFHSRLPYGERLSPGPVLGSPFFPFDGDLAVVPLEEPVVPEPPRNGEPGGKPCPWCGESEHTIWRDALWNVRAGFEPSGLPFVAGLAPREHHRLDELTSDHLTSLGEVVQRLAGTIRRIEGVGRTHFSRWGDGSAHFHMAFLARPLGMMQMRGAMLAVWDDLLPRVPEAEMTTNLRLVAGAMATGGGEAVGAGLPEAAR